jgi:hypothetical protein
MPDDTELTPGQKAAHTKKWRTAGKKAALKKKLRELGGSPKPARGEKMTKGTGWRLVKDEKRIFAGTLLETINIGNTRLAIFSVPK